MATTDSRPVPIKNTAYRLYFPIWKTDGTLITSWTGADTELSKDGGAYADATNEATEIGTSGTGYVEFTSGEMNYDCVLVKITVTNTGAMPVIVALYPEEAGDINVDVTAFGGTAGTFASGIPAVNATQISGNATSADNLEQSALGIVYCNAQGTHSNTSTTTDSSISSVNDFYNGRTMVFVSGSLAGQAARITDYVGATKVFTHTALANSATATNGDDFVVV